MFEERSVLLLCNYDDPTIKNNDCESTKALWAGQYTLLIKQSPVLSAIISKLVSGETLIHYINENKDRLEDVSLLGISALLLFSKVNWSSKKNEEHLSELISIEWPESLDAQEKLQVDSEEIDSNTKYSELLFLASEIFHALNCTNESLLNLWWHLRCLTTHQRVLDNTSQTLYSQVEITTAKLCNLTPLVQDSPRLHCLLQAEICQAFLVYGRVQKAEEHLAKALSIAGLKLQLQGILGKRTKFQQESLSQLALVCELDTSVVRPSADETHGATALPGQVELQDDVRLNSVAYVDDHFKNVKLPSLEQLLCVLTVQYLQKSQPKDNLADEELSPYIETVLRQTHGAWAVRVSALLAKCKLESTNKRTVERAMMQCEAIVTGCVDDDVNRLSYLWASGLQPAWGWRQQLADLYLSLGLVKAALDLFLALRLWEDVIVCYTLLQLRHKAAEIIQQEIDKKATPKLYCLLGDATDDVSCYERAWQLSGHKSSRAQRHWGNYLFERKQYADCIPHFEASLEMNSLQEAVWLRLGYAALSTEQWECSARAYRRYTYLQPHTFEAWNNLAKVYVKQGDKQRAYRALMEALKFNYDNWKLWENVITVSLDTGHFEDVLRGAHRLLDVTGRFRDTEVLSLLARAVTEDHADADGHSSKRLHKRLLELMGRVTSVHPAEPELWQLYADISPTPLLRAQRLQRAYRGFSQETEWPNSPDTCKKVVEFTQTLLESSLEARRSASDDERLQASQQLSSARLTGQAVGRAAERRAWPGAEAALADLRAKLAEVVEFISVQCAE